MNSPLHKYINIFDDVLPDQILNGFLKYAKSLEFTPAKVVGESKQKVDETVRKTLWYSMNDINCKSLTQVHWRNFLLSFFMRYIFEYKKNFKIDENFNVIDIQILKYVNHGHYVFHVDDGYNTPRRLSMIFMLNDEYDGGDIVFKHPETNKETVIKKNKNRLIIWPSNFLYPHSVKKVTNGERYSVVAWAL